MTTLWRAGRWFIALAIFIYLLKEGMFSPNRFSFSQKSIPWIFTSLTSAFITVFGVAVRFHCVLLLLGQRPHFPDVARMFFTGLLVQQIGSEIAFDGMRFVTLHKQGVTPAMIGASVLVDRLLGVSTIFLGTFFFSIYYIKVGNIYWWLTCGLVLLAAIPGFFIVVHRCCGSSSDGLLFRVPGMRLASAVGGTLRLLARKPLRIILLLFFSFLPFLAILFAAYCNSQALGMPLSCGEAMTGAAIASLTALLPLPMAGVGVGESAFGWVISVLRGSGEIVDYAQVFFLSRFFMLMIGCVSWIVAIWLNKSRETFL